MKNRIKKTLFALERSGYQAGIYGKRLTLPHFLNIGPGQSGTTWLFEKLNMHPQLFLPEMKETFYFSRNFNEWSLRYYASIFQAGAGLVRGEMTPGYGILKPARIRDVYRLLPEARLLMTVRNPIERSWSGLRRVLGKLGKSHDEMDEETMFEMLDLEWMYRKDESISVIGDYEQGLLEGEYTRCIDNWLAVFPQESLQVVFFDELVSDPARLLERVSSHLNIRHEGIWSQEGLQKAVNANPRATMPLNIREFLSAKYSDEISQLKKRFGGPAMNWL